MTKKDLLTTALDHVGVHDLVSSLPPPWVTHVPLLLRPHPHVAHTQVAAKVLFLPHERHAAILPVGTNPNPYLQAQEFPTVVLTNPLLHPGARVPGDHPFRPERTWKL